MVSYATLTSLTRPISPLELKAKYNILTKSSFLFADSLVGLWLNSITLSNRSNICKNQTQITVIKLGFV